MKEKAKFLFPFGPGIDEKAEEPFLPISPELAAKKAVQVPFLLGYNNCEGALLYFYGIFLINRTLFCLMR